MSHIKDNLDQTSLVKSCQLTRRIDNNAMIDGYNLYQQYFILSKDGEWTSISQGLNTNNRRARRRYHWHSPTVKSFTNSPHTGIVGKKGKPVINLDSKANKVRKNMLEIVKKPEIMLKECRKITLPDQYDIKEKDLNIKRLGAVMHMAYNKGIDDFGRSNYVKRNRPKH